MRTITISGTCCEIINAPKHNLLQHVGLKKAVTFALVELDIEYVIIDIEFSNDLGSDVWGFCHGDTDSVYIEIDKNIPYKDMLVTLFHELVHAKQIIEGRLIQAEGNNPNVWMGEEFKGSYGDQPWEIEAYKLDESMTRSYLSPMGI